MSLLFDCLRRCPVLLVLFFENVFLLINLSLVKSTYWSVSTNYFSCNYCIFIDLLIVLLIQSLDIFADWILPSLLQVFLSNWHSLCITRLTLLGMKFFWKFFKFLTFIITCCVSNDSVLTSLDKIDVKISTRVSKNGIKLQNNCGGFSRNSGRFDSHSCASHVRRRCDYAKNLTNIHSCESLFQNFSLAIIEDKIHWLVR
jgi:hypothetical protein